MSYTPEEMYQLVDALDLRIKISTDAAASFSDQVVTEISYQIALTMVRDFISTYPEWAEFGRDKTKVAKILSFIRQCRTQPLGADNLVIIEQFEDRQDLTDPFLIKGLELLFAQQAIDADAYYHNLDILQIASKYLDLNHSMLAEQHVRRILSSNQTFQMRLAPGSDVRQATLDWLQSMVNDALEHPLVQLAVVAGDGGVAHGALPMLPGGEVIGAQAQAEVMAQTDYEALMVAYQENARLGMGVILALATGDSKTDIVDNVTRIWSGRSTPENRDLNDLLHKDDTAG